jgi:crotonobetainyl-CoA:carnitine CoA-transferase CaiB-like acyl-CoA transferase
MGGRVSGESPREKKVEMSNCVRGALRPYAVTDTADDEMAIAATQTSKQQLGVCTPLGQQDLCVTS